VPLPSPSRSVAGCVSRPGCGNSRECLPLARRARSDDQAADRPLRSSAGCAARRPGSPADAWPSAPRLEHWGQRGCSLAGSGVARSVDLFRRTRRHTARRWVAPRCCRGAAWRGVLKVQPWRTVRHSHHV
jgi:hypothetical protein